MSAVLGEFMSMYVCSSNGNTDARGFLVFSYITMLSTLKVGLCCWNLSRSGSLRPLPYIMARACTDRCVLYSGCA